MCIRDSIYALHGVLAAPFCAALAAWHLVRGGSVVQLVAATALLAAVLGMMSPAMGLSFALVAALTLAVRACLRSVPAAMRSGARRWGARWLAAGGRGRDCR